MRGIMKIDSLPKALSFMLWIGSLALIGWGFYAESYWSALGLVLLMTSLMLICGLSKPDYPYAVTQKKETTWGPVVPLSHYPFKKA